MLKTWILNHTCHFVHSGDLVKHVSLMSMVPTSFAQDCAVSPDFGISFRVIWQYPGAVCIHGSIDQ